METKKQLDKETALFLLDEIDELRRKHKNDAVQNNDWVLRVACAIIAKSAGYIDRVSWIDDLKADEATKYAIGAKSDPEFYF